MILNAKNTTGIGKIVTRIIDANGLEWEPNQVHELNTETGEMLILDRSVFGNLGKIKTAAPIRVEYK